MEKILELEREIGKLDSRMAAAEEQHRTIFNRLSQQDRMLDSVHSLAQSVAVMSNDLAATKTAVNGMREDVEELKAKPAKRWDSIAEKVLLCIVGAVVGFFLTKIGF